MRGRTGELHGMFPRFFAQQKAATPVAALISVTLRKSAASVGHHHHARHGPRGLHVHRQAVAVHRHLDDHPGRGQAHDLRPDPTEDDPMDLGLPCLWAHHD